MSSRVTENNHFYRLPYELQLKIFSFDPTFIQRFKTSLAKVNDQFYKGGFYRKNLRVDRYIKKQEWCCRKFWRSKHPEMLTDNRNDRRKIPVIKEWDVKKAKAICAVYYREHWSRPPLTIRHLLPSGATIVSTWIKNIKKFEEANKLLESK